MANEAMLFLRQFISNPLQVSSVAPSSRWLARAMAQSLGPTSGRVVEFGPGTGVLTQGILAAGVAAKDLTLFEMSPDFTKLLRQKFPDVTVHNAPAQSAVTSVQPGVSAVISGLPLLSMPLAVRESIVKAAFDILAPDGVYVQFTYGSKPPLSLEQLAQLGLKVSERPKVWLNIPPARVFHFRRA
ncbi:class I SAM-dependent methyltransferase [Cypionkella sp.]|uniref:class I SAM-dependent methyltransferase n=1 Tax=Cypionkella sp. TaxID=2811411 RepID=UPI002620969C|nr:rRNA adenine N-6-methyltransferase family protein [Cypionkella sp.]MDB5665455.1 hypothetical protein [Cypionkella sp.]